MKRGARAGPPRLLANRFEVVSLRGIGPHGIVHKVYDQKEQARLRGLKVVCALRILEPSILPQKQIERHEFELITRLRTREPVDRTFAMPYEFLKLGALHGCLTEYIEGVDIDRYTAVQTFSHAEAVRIVHDIAKAMGRLHKEGIVHGYLHPRNILITDEGQVKITELGWANLPMALIGRRYPRALQHYLAPELLSNFGCDKRADIFSIGCLIVLLLTRMEGVKDLPKGFLARATNPYPEKRFESMEELAFEFEESISPRSRAPRRTQISPVEGYKQVLNFVIPLLFLSLSSHSFFPLF